MEYEIERFLHAPLAQLDRVAHYECEGWGFESLMAHQRNPVIATVTGFNFFLDTFLNRKKGRAANLIEVHFLFSVQ